MNINEELRQYIETYIFPSYKKNDLGHNLDHIKYVIDRSFELVKVFDKNIQIGIKLDVKDDYLYVATLHSITNGKLQHGIENGRLKKV